MLALGGASVLFVARSPSSGLVGVVASPWVLAKVTLSLLLLWLLLHFLLFLALQLQYLLGIQILGLQTFY
jgi:hypothetical protein